MEQTTRSAAIFDHRTFPYLKCVQSRYVEFPVCRKTYEQHRQRIIAARPAVDSGLPLCPGKLDARSSDHDWMRHQERAINLSKEDYSKRRREMEQQQLALENKVLSKKLESQGSRYDRNKHRRDWLLHEERVTRISKYDHPWKSVGNLPQKLGFLPPIHNPFDKRT